jgi:hypothetical protein
MEPSQKLSLVMPRQSPKMSRIYTALEEGWPDAKSILIFMIDLCCGGL